LKDDFDKYAEFQPQEIEKEEWMANIETHIDQKMAMFGGWLKGQLKASVAVLNQRVEREAHFDLPTYLADPTQWQMNFDRFKRKMMFQQRKKLDTKMIQSVYKKAFLGNLWAVLPIAARASIQGTLLESPDLAVDTAEISKTVDSDLYTLIEKVAARTKGAAKNREMVEVHSQLFQKELDFKRFEIDLDEGLQKASKQLEVAQQQIKKAKDAHFVSAKLSKFKESGSNRQLNNIIWPNNQLAVSNSKLADFKAVFVGNAKIEDLFSRNTYHFFSKKDLETLKKSTKQWSSDAKRKFFAKFEALTDFFLYKSEKKALRKLNANRELKYTDFQALEATFFRYKVPQASWAEAEASLKEDPLVTGSPEVQSILSRDSHLQLTYVEAKKYFDETYMSPLKELARNDLRHRCSIASLGDFFKLSEATNAEIAAELVNLHKTKALCDKKMADVKELRAKIAKDENLLRVVREQFIN